MPEDAGKLDTLLRFRRARAPTADEDHYATRPDARLPATRFTLANRIHSPRRGVPPPAFRCSRHIKPRAVSRKCCIALAPASHSASKSLKSGGHLKTYFNFSQKSVLVAVSESLITNLKSKLQKNKMADLISLV